MKSDATKYVKLNEEIQRAVTAPYHIVTERSLTGKRKLKAKCVANESSTPSQRLLQQKKARVTVQCTQFTIPQNSILYKKID